MTLIIWGPEGASSLSHLQPFPPIVGSAGVPGQESVSSPLLGSSPTTRGAPGSLVGPGVILLTMFIRYYLAEITKSRVLCPSS